MTQILHCIFRCLLCQSPLCCVRFISTNKTTKADVFLWCRLCPPAANKAGDDEGLLCWETGGSPCQLPAVQWPRACGLPPMSSYFFPYKHCFGDFSYVTNKDISEPFTQCLSAVCFWLNRFLYLKTSHKSVQQSKHPVSPARHVARLCRFHYC